MTNNNYMVKLSEMALGRPLSMALMSTHDKMQAFK